MANCPNCGGPLSWVNEYEQWYCTSCQAYPSSAPPPVRARKSEAALTPKIVAVIVVIVILVVAALTWSFISTMNNIDEALDDLDSLDYYITPFGHWNDVEALSSTSGRLTFGIFSNDVDPTDLRLYVEKDGASAGSITWVNPTSSETLAVWTGGPQGASVNYVDLDTYDDGVSAGDYITLTGLEPDTTYSFELYHIPTSSTIFMTGTAAQFTTW